MVTSLNIVLSCILYLFFFEKPFEGKKLEDLQTNANPNTHFNIYQKQCMHAQVSGSERFPPTQKNGINS